MTKRAWSLLLLLALTGLSWALFHHQIGRFLCASVFLHSSHPAPELFEHVTSNLSDPSPFLQRCWDTQKVPHRQLVASFLRDKASADVHWFTNVHVLLRAACYAPDLSVREMALATLKARGAPDLFECARPQLDDPDPEVRRLGLDYLRHLDAQRGVPTLIKLLNDPDLRVLASAEVALMRWTDQDFGVRTFQAVPSPEDGAVVSRAHLDSIRQGVSRRKEWWKAHATEYPEWAPARVPKEAAPRELRVENFTLVDLNGKKVRLESFRGKPVLVNFWATWCPPCLEEIPELVALQNRLGERIVILGVALDGVPVDDGQQTGVKQGDRVAREIIHSKVAHVAKTRGMNYSVLLDSDAAVGSRYNCRELPTTIIVDADGHLRRRFIGPRKVEVFQAVMQECVGGQFGVHKPL